MTQADETHQTNPTKLAELETRTGLRLEVRRVAPADEPALSGFFRQVTSEDLRFRFLSAVKEMSHARLMEMIEVDQDRTESFLIVAPGNDAVLAVAMLASDPEDRRAEVAISIRADCKGRGIGWTLLEYLAEHAKTNGIQLLESIESRANHSAIDLEREMGFVAEPVEGDSTLVLLRRKLG